MEWGVGGVGRGWCGAERDGSYEAREEEVALGYLGENTRGAKFQVQRQVRAARRRSALFAKRNMPQHKHAHNHKHIKP